MKIGQGRSKLQKMRKMFEIDINGIMEFASAHLPDPDFIIILDTWI